MKKFLFSALMIMMDFSVNLNAQDESGSEEKKGFDSGKFISTLSLGFNTGPNITQSDLRQYDWYPVLKYRNEWGWAASLTLNKQFSPAFSLQGQLFRGSLRGTGTENNSLDGSEISLHIFDLTE
jgi:hypothetical protein